MRILLRVINTDDGALWALSKKKRKDKCVEITKAPTPSITLTIAALRAKLAITVIKRKDPAAFFHANASPTDLALRY